MCGVGFVEDEHHLILICPKYDCLGKIDAMEVQKFHHQQKDANSAGENSSFIFTVCVKSVPLYHLKLPYIVLHMAVKEFFETCF